MDLSESTCSKRPLEKIYPPRFFARRNSLNWRAKIICDAIDFMFLPSSVIDVGCAIGDLVAEWIRRGVSARGLEGSAAVIPYLATERENITIADLREPINVGQFELATCFEVAEHIEPEYADRFVENLVGMSEQILISVAPPGQGGHYHVNCRPIEYWIEKFATHGYRFGEDNCRRVKERLKEYRHKAGIKAIYMNLAYFEGRAEGGD